jgi:DNA-binding transcriptional LysR family regulator
MPDWESLRIFLALARTGTMAGAARKLGLDETTVARRVLRLEQELPARLVERSRSGFALTAAGESVLDAAQEMERAALAAERRAVGADRELSGRVRLTAPEILANHFILPALLDFRLRHPGIALELVSTIVRLDVSRREADVAIRTLRPTEPSLVSRKVARMAFAPYVRRGRGRPAAAIGYVDSIRLPMRNVADRAAAGPVALRTNSVATALAAVRSGWGVGDLPCFVGDALPDLRRAFPGEPPDAMDVWLILHADVQRTARVRAVVDELVRIFRDGAAVLAARSQKDGLG